MDLNTIATLIFFCGCASLIQRVTGFGFGIFAMTMLPHIMPSYGEATALSGLLSAALALFVAFRMRKFLNWRHLLPILATFVAVSYFSISFVASVDDKLLKHILGGALIAISIYFFFFSEKIKLKPSYPVQISMGTLSGIMGGLFAIQGPPAVLYFLASEKTKEEYLAGIQTYFFIGNVMMSLFRAKAGFVTPAVGFAWCYGMIAVVIGAFVGGKIFKRIPIKILRKVVYAYMAISGVIALLS